MCFLISNSTYIENNKTFKRKTHFLNLKIKKLTKWWGHVSKYTLNLNKNCLRYLSISLFFSILFFNITGIEIYRSLFIFKKLGYYLKNKS